MSLEYTGVSNQRLLPLEVEDHLMGLVARAGGLVMLVAAVFGWGSLLSWKITDPSISYTTTEPVRNLFGFPGAVLSDLLIQTLGFGAVFILLAPVVWGLELLGSTRVADFKIKFALLPV